jgi:hypothetical protein
LDFDFGVVLFCQGVMMTVVYMNTHDVYQIFLRFNVPGVRKDAGRLWKGVNSGDAGVMNELLQAACDPSAGQRAVQAGEAVQQPCLAEERRFELKRKADVYELELAERQLQVTDLQLEQKRKADLHELEVQKQKLEHVDRRNRRPEAAQQRQRVARQTLFPRKTSIPMQEMSCLMPALLRRMPAGAGLQMQTMQRAVVCPLSLH